MRSWGGAEVWFLDTVRELRVRGISAGLVAQPNSELLRRAHAENIPCAAIPIRFDAAPWTLLKLARHFRQTRTTAIVTNRTKDLKAAAVAGRLARVPIILASRESDFPLKDNRYYRWYFQQLASGVLVNSEATRNTVLSSAPWLDPDRVHLLYKGIDTGRFQPAPPAPQPESPIVGFVGQLIERKGLLELMAAWSSIDAAERPDRPVLRIAGEGPLVEKLHEWRQGLRRPRSVEICGFVEDIASFYRDCSLITMPSSSEGFGLAAAEASACGLPVVAANASSLPEIVLHRETGLLIRPGHAAALAEAIVALLDDPGLAARLGTAGRARIATRFTRDQTLDQLLQLTGGPDLSGKKGTPRC
jgi:glycosyltransferase involved in cell wall biosynthesis